MKNKDSIHPSWLNRNYVYVDSFCTNGMIEGSYDVVNLRHTKNFNTEEENDMSCQENAALLENYFEQFFEELISSGIPELVAEEVAEHQARKRLEERG